MGVNSCMAEIKVGDVIYGIADGKPGCAYTVTRTTKTLAISKNQAGFETRFKRYGTGFEKVLTPNSWGVGFLSIVGKLQH